MVRLDILIHCLILMYRENILSQTEEIEDSKELIKSILTFNKRKTKILMGGNTDSQSELYNIVMSMCLSSVSQDLETIIIELSTALKNDQDLLSTIKSQLEQNMTTGGLKRSILNIKNKLLIYYKELSIVKEINKANYELNNDKNEVSITEYANILITNLEAYCSNVKINDPGLVDKVVLSNKEDLDKITEKIKAESQEGGILKTGWRQINKMTQGGFRKGETVVLNALQHSYKSGFTQSLVMQLARFNKPLLENKDKKPCIIYISLEDEIMNILKFMYKYLYYNENNKLPDKTDDDISLLSSEQLQDYVLKRLGINGYEVILYRGDPGLWTYKNIFNIITELEVQGYEVHACFVDYLAKLPTTFCDTTGPTGTAMRDLFNRCRNFFSKKGILFFTPHQLNTEAKALMKNGVPEKTFVKEIAGKGYTEMSKQIDQVVDLELYIHKVKLEDKGYGLTVQRGKHRVPTIIDDEDMYCILKFPYRAPIKEDLNDENFQEVDASSSNDNIFML